MKIRGRELKFYYPTFAWTTGPRFVTRDSSIDLQQAAMVVEGYVAKIRFLGMEGLYPHPMCEWTTMTIPYTKISRVFYSRLAPFRILSWAIVALISLAALAAMVRTGRGWEFLLLLAIPWLLTFCIFPSRCVNCALLAGPVV